MASQNTPDSPSHLDDNQGTKSNKNAERRPPIVLEATPYVKIANLDPRNNNSSFIGKIQTLNITIKGVNKSNQPRRFLKGVIGDETGVVDFDLAEKDNVSFEVGDVVSFEKAMNKINKERHHYVEVKRYGFYKIHNGHAAIEINNSINKSEAIIPESAEDQERKKNKRHRKFNDHNNSSGNQQQPRSSNKPQGHQGHANNNNNNNNSGKVNHNNQSTDKKPYQKQPHHQQQQSSQQQQRPPKTNFIAYIRPTLIKNLTPNKIKPGSVIFGQVSELKAQVKTVRGNEETFYKGRIGDSSGTIKFDFAKQDNLEIRENDVIQITNLVNLVVKGYHQIGLDKSGFYTVIRSNTVPNTENNLSTIVYEKKEV